VRAIIDTNVLLSGLLEHVRAGTLAMVSSPALLAELVDVISRPKFDSILVRSKTTREKLLTEVRQLAEVIEPPPLAAPVCRDPDDDEVLALALAAQVDLIISGDEDLLVLQVFEGIPILTPAMALQFIGGGGEPLAT
jgi:uncharacterized protein